MNFCSIGGAGIFQWMSGPVVEAYTVVKDPSVQYEALFFFYAVLMSIAITAYAFSKDAKP